MPKSRAPLNGSTPTGVQWIEMKRLEPMLPQLIQDIHADSPGEFSVIGGRTGIGKTNLQMYMGLCLATGTPFFGRRCEPVGVNMLTFEGPEQNLRERLETLMKQFPDDEGRFHFEFLAPRSRAELFKTVKERLAKTAGCKVAILDSVKYIVDGDYLKSEVVTYFLNELLKPFLTGIGMSANLALPIKKPLNQGVLIDVEDVYNIKGATEWVDASVTTILLEKRHRKPKEHVTLGFAKTRIAVNDMPPMRLFFDKKLCLFKREVVRSSDFDENDDETSVQSNGTGMQIRASIP